MRAIETFYDGYKFRSRTEARWADFLKTLGIEYRYEYEGFLLVPPGEPYLPDFYLPELGYWIEVKGTVPNEDEQRKAGLLNYGLVFDAATENQRVYILYGDIPWPYPKKGHAIGYSVSDQVGRDPSDEDSWGGLWGLCWQQCPLCLRIGIGPYNAIFCRKCLTLTTDILEDQIEKKLGRFLEAGEHARDMVDVEFFKSGHHSPQLRKAYTAARPARFERMRSVS